jgi:hypothetical protein
MVCLALTRHAGQAGAKAPAAQPPALVTTCLITTDVKSLVDFHERVLQIKANRISAEYAEYPTNLGVLAVFASEAQERYIPGSVQPAQNKSAILEFRVTTLTASTNVYAVWSPRGSTDQRRSPGARARFVFAIQTGISSASGCLPPRAGA